MYFCPIFSYPFISNPLLCLSTSVIGISCLFSVHLFPLSSSGTTHVSSQHVQTSLTFSLVFTILSVPLTYRHTPLLALTLLIPCLSVNSHILFPSAPNPAPPSYSQLFPPSLSMLCLLLVPFMS